LIPSVALKASAIKVLFGEFGSRFIVRLAASHLPTIIPTKGNKIANPIICRTTKAFKQIINTTRNGNNKKNGKTIIKIEKTI